MRPSALRPAAPGAVVMVAVALCALIAACGSVTQSPSPTGGATAPASSGAPNPSGGTDAVRVYFALGSTAGNPVLAPVERPAAGAADLTAKAKSALDALVAGPSEAELAATPALFTSIPAGTTVTGIQISSAGVATVDFSSGFEETDALPALRTALGQVVFTLTQFPDVTGVQVTIKGAVLSQTNADGQDLAAPATRADYGDVMGPLFVDGPVWGATLHSPFQLSGLADVFEAQFRFRLLDADGRSLADGQLTASCGTGCLGRFGVPVQFNVPKQATGHLQVFDLSEVDGSPQDVVDYPVTLLP